MQEGLENRRDRCTWQRVQMFVGKVKVSTTNQDYFVASVYHPPTLIVTKPLLFSVFN